MEEKLKPCPFCGGVAQIVNVDSVDEQDPNAGGSYVACQFCLASSRVIFVEKAGLVEAWNSRADDARIRAEARAEAHEEYGDLICAARATIKATDRVAFAWKVGKCGPLSPKSCYIPDIARALEQLRAAILADEPAEEARPADAQKRGEAIDWEAVGIEFDEFARKSFINLPGEHYELKAAQEAGRMMMHLVRRAFRALKPADEPKEERIEEAGR